MPCFRNPFLSRGHSSPVYESDLKIMLLFLCLRRIYFLLFSILKEQLFFPCRVLEAASRGPASPVHGSDHLAVPENSALGWQLRSHLPRKHRQPSCTSRKSLRVFRIFFLIFRKLFLNCINWLKIKWWKLWLFLICFWETKMWSYNMQYFVQF